MSKRFLLVVTLALLLCASAFPASIYWGEIHSGSVTGTAVDTSDVIRLWDNMCGMWLWISVTDTVTTDSIDIDAFIDLSVDTTVGWYAYDSVMAITDSAGYSLLEILDDTGPFPHFMRIRTEGNADNDKTSAVIFTYDQGIRRCP
jgi:hypothetical protein